MSQRIKANIGRRTSCKGIATSFYGCSDRCPQSSIGDDFCRVPRDKSAGISDTDMLRCTSALASSRGEGWLRTSNYGTAGMPLLCFPVVFPARRRLNPGLSANGIYYRARQEADDLLRDHKTISDGKYRFCPFAPLFSFF